MKLCELFPDPTDLLDPLYQADELDRNSFGIDLAHKGEKEKKHTERRDSNLAKAKRIRNLAKMKARDATKNDNEDTPHKYNLGAHGSAFLFR